MRLATILAIRLPSPRSVSSSVWFLLPVKRNTLSQKGLLPSSGGMFSIPSARKACASSLAPSSADSVSCMVLRWWRILERARPVRTKLSQAGLGVDVGAVMTSTTSPFLSAVRKGTCSPLMRAAMVRSPTLLWMA